MILFTNVTLVEFVIKRNIVSKFIYDNKIGLGRDLKLVDSITPYLKGKIKILDIGCGLCRIAKILQDKGYEVIPVDIQNLSVVHDIRPIIYDGKKLPFENNSIDTSLLLTVLHHTKNPEAVLKEVKRVSKSIIVIEDIYKNTFHKYLTFGIDSLVNLEFIGHPHTNKDDEGWKMLFKKLNLKLKASKKMTIWAIFLLGIYYLEK